MDANQPLAPAPMGSATGVASPAPGTRTVPLAYPLDAGGGRVVGEVTLRRPRVGDTVAAQRGASSPAEIEVRLVSALTGLPVAAVEAMDMQDYSAVQQSLREMVGG